MSVHTSSDHDPLTALQTSYDQLLTQLYSTLSYLSQRHPVIPPISDPQEPYTRHPLPSSVPQSQPQSAILPPSTSAPHSVPTAEQQTNGTTPQPAPTNGGTTAEKDLIYQPGPEDASPTRTDNRPLLPDTPGLFRASQHELAEDLILKVSEIHDLIDALPDDDGAGTDAAHGQGGRESAEERDERRIRGLGERVRSVEGRRREKRREARGLVRRLDGVVLGMARGVENT